MGSISQEDIRAGLAEGMRMYLEKHHEEMKRLILESISDLWLEPMNSPLDEVKEKNEMEMI